MYTILKPESIKIIKKHGLITDLLLLNISKKHQKYEVLFFDSLVEVSIFYRALYINRVLQKEGVRSSYIYRRIVLKIILCYFLVFTNIYAILCELVIRSCTSSIQRYCILDLFLAVKFFLPEKDQEVFVGDMHEIFAFEKENSSGLNAYWVIIIHALDVLIGSFPIRHRSTNGGGTAIEGDD